MKEAHWDCNDTATFKYRWEYDTTSFPESIQITEYLNEQIQQVMDVREEAVTDAVIALMRAKGYIVIEPEGD